MLGPYVQKYPCTARIVQDRMNESIEFFLKVITMLFIVNIVDSDWHAW